MQIGNRQRWDWISSGVVDGILISFNFGGFTRKKYRGLVKKWDI